MYAANFCIECGGRLSHGSWRERLRGSLCEHCAERRGASRHWRPAVAIAAIAVAGFAVGRYLRPPPPPLIIQRTATAALSELPVKPNQTSVSATPAVKANANADADVLTADDAVYICGARTKKGTPCQRRVHAAGERCFQHKGMPSSLPLSKLVIKR